VNSKTRNIKLNDEEETNYVHLCRIAFARGALNRWAAVFQDQTTRAFFSLQTTG